MTGDRSPANAGIVQPKKRPIATTAAVVALLSLTGCVSSDSTVESRFAILAEEATAEDQLPAEPYDDAYDSVEVASARYGGEADGVRYWIAVGTLTGTVCVVVVPEAGAETMVGCGGDAATGRGREQVSMGVTGGPEVHLLADGAPQVDISGWQQVSDNLWVG